MVRGPVDLDPHPDPIGDQGAGLEPAVGGHRGDQGHATALGGGAEHHGPDVGLVADGQGQGADRIAVEPVDAGHDVVL